MNYKTIISTISLIALTSCANQMTELENVGSAPALEQVMIPMEKNNYEPIEWNLDEEIDDRPSHANSLWAPGARAFFKDIKARRIGDILKVIVSVSDKAEIDNTTTRTRDHKEKSAATRIFGLEEKIVGMLPGVANPAALLDVASANNSSGTGTIAREEIITTEIAAMVTQILPNGNLVIHGDQEIRVNFEVRKITIDGIIRPEDIAADNSIDSRQIAEARISYGGRGQITNVQQPRIGNQIIDILSPF